MRQEPRLAENADRLRWNAKYGPGFTARFEPHPAAIEALRVARPPSGVVVLGGRPGPVLELASGPSGSALFAAEAGWPVVAVDASDVALTLLADEAGRRGLSELITLVHADLLEWRPPSGRYAVVVCTEYWDKPVFLAAVQAVAPGGLLAWEAYTIEAHRDRATFPDAWCLTPGEPASLLPSNWLVLNQTDQPGAKRRLLARRPE